MAVGVAIYFMYSVRRSNLALPDLAGSRAGAGERS
jgi:hypothetical protein